MTNRGKLAVCVAYAVLTLFTWPLIEGMILKLLMLVPTRLYWTLAQSIAGALSALVLVLPFAAIVRPRWPLGALAFGAAVLLVQAVVLVSFGVGEVYWAWLRLPDTWAFLGVAVISFRLASYVHVQSAASQGSHRK